MGANQGGDAGQSGGLELLNLSLTEVFPPPPLLSRQPSGFSCGVCFVAGKAICQVPRRLSPWGMEVKLIVFNFV